MECEVREAEVFPSPNAVRDYLRLPIGDREYEVFVCVFLNVQVRRLAPTISGPQQAQIQKLVVQTGTDLSRLLEHFSIAKLADLPTAELVRVVRTLENQRAA